MNHYEISRHKEYLCSQFHAMASPCELLFDTLDENLAATLTQKALASIRHLEKKFSRYISNNLCYAINHANGQPTLIDNECYRLLTFAHKCFDLSDGMFDLTSGVLRRAWTFDGGNHIPSQQEINNILPYVGWHKVHFDEQHIQMPAGMEIDFGGIGKEYAVSVVADLCRRHAPTLSVLINLGGDIQVTQPRKHSHPWHVGIENHDQIISIFHGALATSGDTKRFVLKNNQRYSHILNPKTGWPIMSGPSSITTYAPLCVQAGCLATLALLNGKKAESFLSSQNVKYWCTYT